MKKKTSESPSSPGSLILDLDVVLAGTAGVLRFRIPSLALVRSGGDERVGGDVSVEIASNRQFRLDMEQGYNLRFFLPVPTGDYEVLRLRWEQLAMEGEAKTAFPQSGEHAFPISLSVSAGAPAHVWLLLDPAALMTDQPVDAALQVSASSRESRLERRFEPGQAMLLRRAADFPGLDDAGMPGLRVPPDGFPAGARVVLRENTAADLPPLFRQQRRVGPVITVDAEQAPRQAVEVIVPYDETLVGQAGVRVEDLIVMRLETGGRRYHELRPARIDSRSRTLAVRTQTLSDFFACTPGILIRFPELSPTRWDLIGVVGGLTTSVAGRVTDESAVVTLVRPQAASGWAGMGWFEFQGVPVDGPSTQVELEARVEGQVPHTCAFTLKAEQPPKRVALTNRLYGPSLDVSPGDLPAVAAVLNHCRLSGEGLKEGLLGDWQRRYLRPEPFVYQQGLGGSFWRRTALLPETYFENECARQAVEEARLVVDHAAPEAERYLDSIASFLRMLSEDDPRRGIMLALLGDAGGCATPASGAAAEFSAGQMMLSPVTPVLAGDGEDFSAAFVAASLPGRRQAASSGMQPLLAALHTHPRQEWGDRPAVYAGRLFFVRLADGALRRELVAEDVWCATVVLRPDPESGQPAIAALGLAPDEDGEPRSELRLYRRGRDGDWTPEVVLAGQPVVDFDFTFAPDGSARFVAVLPGRDVQKWRLVDVRRQDGRWTAEPLFYRLPGQEKAIDHGARPRLHFDPSGRAVVVFLLYFASVSWVVAVEGSPWQAARIQTAQHIDLTGSPFQSEAIVPLDIPVTVSGLSVFHWGPATVPDGEGGLWCAYGNGMLNLARIDLETLQAAPVRLDVDRMTGFYPALGLRANGAPAVVYKDPWGFGGFGDPGAQDELHFLSVDDGSLTPLSPDFAPTLPPFSRGAIGILRDFHPNQKTGGPEGDLLPYFPLSCANLSDINLFNQVLFSVLAYAKFQVEIYPSGGDYPAHRLNYRLTHSWIARMIEDLARRPQITVFVIDNSAVEEEIERIDITQFDDPVGSIAASFAADLDQSNVTGEIRMAFRGQGLVMSSEPVAVTVQDRGSAWDLVDSSAFMVGSPVPSPVALVYQVRREEMEEDGEEVERLVIRILPVVSIIDRAVMRGPDGRRAPCGRTQEDWDVIAAELTRRFTGLGIELPDDVPGQIRQVMVRDIHMTACEAWDPPNDQQGGVRFTFTIPQVTFRNANPDASGWTTGPSFLWVTLTPFANSGGNISWVDRDVQVSVSPFETDVDVGIFSWLKWFSVIPGLGFLFLAADPLADSIATSKVNEEPIEPDPGGIVGTLREAMQGFSNRVAGPGHPFFEGVYLRDRLLRTWVRGRLPLPAGSDLNITPRGVNFGQLAAGSPAVRRNVLLANDGNVPVLLEDVVLAQGAPDMAIDSPRQWPSTITPGDALVITLSFIPQGEPGFRDGELQVRFNGGQAQTVALFANVLPPPQSPLRAQPPSLQFGILNAGTPADREVELFNDGQSIVEIQAARVTGPQAGAFELRSDPRGVILGGASTTLRVRFRPPAGLGSRYDARVVLDTNLPAFPEVQIDLTGFAIVSELLVNPTSLQFNDSPLGPNLPPLPPGLPPTVHQGSTRSFTIGNTGLADLQVTANSFRAIDSAGAVSTHYRLWDIQGAALAPAPRTLRSGETFVVVVEFFPISAGDHPAVMNIQPAGLAQPAITVNISGRGIA